MHHAAPETRINHSDASFGRANIIYLTRQKCCIGQGCRFGLFQNRDKFFSTVGHFKIVSYRLTKDLIFDIKIGAHSRLKCPV